MGAGFSARAGIPLMDTLLKLTMERVRRIEYYVRIYKKLGAKEIIRIISVRKATQQ